MARSHHGLVRIGRFGMTLFEGRYRVESARLPGWDYTRPGWYFVTTCTRNRAPVLADVVDGRVHLSAIGRIVAEEWRRTEVVRPNVILDAWVVMPDHLHGVIRITHRLPSTRRPFQRSSRLQAGSIGAIVGQFKSACTKRIRAAGHPAFGWQPRFHEDVVRDHDHLAAIRNYIANNPHNWNADR